MHPASRVLELMPTRITPLSRPECGPSVAGSTFNNQVSIQSEGIKSFVALAVTSNLPAAISPCGCVAR
ncbi:hypothetical protein BDZ89DRAFT_1071538 [Hymenopellis radicata]|nr:hypothetical protein BDZ89DRAFT_1071538 [Hymenopellis radicata]